VKFKGTLIGPASGSVAGSTYSRNRGGQYVRVRATPTNPQTEFQVAVRASMQQLTSRWNTVLTGAQRESWDTYALNVPIPDTLGDPRNVGGIGMYCRSNIPRLQASLGLIDNAPTQYNLGTFTPPSWGNVDASDGTGDVTFTPADPWASTAGGAAFVLVSRGQNPSVNFFKGPYRFAGVILGAGTPPTSPAEITLPFPVAAGQKVFAQIRIQQADGRLSAPLRFPSVAVA
jgi:hypothetical protein